MRIICRSRKISSQTSQRTVLYQSVKHILNGHALPQRSKSMNIRDYDIIIMELHGNSIWKSCTSKQQKLNYGTSWVWVKEEPGMYCYSITVYDAIQTTTIVIPLSTLTYITSFFCYFSTFQIQGHRICPPFRDI